jgi:GNAT superfamily N-acetyltransferase
MQPARLFREKVTLRDDRTVVLRPIRTSDAPHLIALHERLSTETQYMRFFGPKPFLSEAEAAYLASVDHVHRFAIVAVAGDDDEAPIVGVGRFDVQQDFMAEPAIVIRDDYQGAGLGRAILERLVEIGRGRALHAFKAEVLAENTRMIDMLRGAGLEVSQVEGGIVTVTAPMTDIPLILRGLGLVTRIAESILTRPSSGADGPD